MRRLLKYALMAPLVLALSIYVTAAGALYLDQREIIYQPSGQVIGPPPAGSIYAALPVNAPTGGRLMVWAAKAEEGLPTIVFFHGNASTITDFAEEGRKFHDVGWGVVLASYRGYSGNDGEPSEQGLFEDGRAILSALDTSGPVILWGHSLGSGVAAQLASEKLCDALILESPFTSLADIGSELYPYFPVRLLLTDRFDNASLVTQIDMPILIFHSRDDRIVPFGLGERLSYLFGANAMFVPLDNLGHYPHQTDLSGLVTRWARLKAITS